jgi:hypothetical protein
MIDPIDAAGGSDIDRAEFLINAAWPAQTSSG